MVKYDSQKMEYQLNIDSGYYNTLDIEGFSRMMKDPSYCYKFYWLEAIVQLISQDRKEATYDEIINEMIANSKARNIAVAAIARELACFVWGMMTENISVRAV